MRNKVRVRFNFWDEPQAKYIHRTAKAIMGQLKIDSREFPAEQFPTAEDLVGALVVRCYDAVIPNTIQNIVGQWTAETLGKVAMCAAGYGDGKPDRKAPTRTPVCLLVPHLTPYSDWYFNPRRTGWYIMVDLAAAVILAAMVDVILEERAAHEPVDSERIQQAEMDRIDGRIDGDTLAEIRAGIDGR